MSECAPRDPNIRVQLADALFQAGDVQQAAAATSIGLGIDPRHEALNRLQVQLDYLAERLRKAFPNFKPDQVKPQTYSVTVSFLGSGLDVDVVPILYSGDP